jgi:hypothetical protein
VIIHPQIQMPVSATAVMITMLIVSIVLSFAVVAIFPVHEASAKQCNSDDNNNDNNKNNKNNADTHRTICTHDQQDSKNHDPSNTTTKDKTPFVLSLPFP